MSERRLFKNLTLIILITVLVTNFVIASDDIVGEDIGRTIMSLKRGEEPNTAPAEEEIEAIEQVKPAEPEIMVTPPEIKKIETPEISTPVETAKEVKETVTAVNDRLLNTIPANCLFAVRINKFDTSMGEIDKYLIGISPMPIAIKIKTGR